MNLSAAWNKQDEINFRKKVMPKVRKEVLTFINKQVDSGLDNHSQTDMIESISRELKKFAEALEMEWD